MDRSGSRMVLRNERKRRRTMLDPGINNAPPRDNNKDDAGHSSRAGLQLVQPNQRLEALSTDLIDVEAIDDEVFLSSPGAFAEAKSNSRRRRERAIVMDVDSGDLVVQRIRLSVGRSNKRRRPQTIINCDNYINLESNSNSTEENAKKPEEHPTNIRLPTPPPPPTYKCPICLGTLVEEMSTKCGHIFCKLCIQTAIASQSKCPTCRKRITKNGIIRVYLPATS